MTKGLEVRRLQAGLALHSVNDIQARRQAERPNETFKSDDIGRILTGKGVIILESIGERLEEILNSDDVRRMRMGKSVIVIEGRVYKYPLISSL